jgi:hypothetical protein
VASFEAGNSESDTTETEAETESESSVSEPRPEPKSDAKTQKKIARLREKLQPFKVSEDLINEDGQGAVDASPHLRFFYVFDPSQRRCILWSDIEQFCSFCAKNHTNMYFKM